VDPEDQMSVDSYFFASFQDDEHAFAAIQQRLEERPSSDLPRFTSDLSLETIRVSEPDKKSLASSKDSSSGPLGIKKLGSILKPFKSHANDKVDDSDSSDGKSGLSIPFLSKSHKPSHDSLETLRTESIDPLDDEDDGYPPRQNGTPPRGLHGDGGKGWTGWIRKPKSKIFGSSPSQSSLKDRVQTDPTLGAGLTDTPVKSVESHPSGRKRSSVTEVIEPVVLGGKHESSDDEDIPYRRRRRSSRGPRVSFASQSSSDGHQQDRSDYSMMEESESGNREDEETAQKFRNVFSLSEKEELIDRT